MALFEAFQRLSVAKRAEFVARAVEDPAMAATILSSSVQERLVFLSLLADGDDAYTLGWAGRVEGPMRTDALDTAFTALGLRHEQLTRRFVMAGRRTLSLTSEASLIGRHEHRTGMEPRAREADAAATAERELRRPFEVLDEPLTRLTTVSYSEDDHLLVFCVHHAVVDGWSWGRLQADLAEFYGAVLEGTLDTTTTATAPAVTYADHVALEHTEAADGTHTAALERWRTELAGAPKAVSLPVDLPRKGFAGFGGAVVRGRLSPRDTAAVDALAAWCGATRFMTLLGLYARALHLHCGDDDIVIGTPVTGRPSARFDEVVGMFVNTIPIRLRGLAATDPAAWVDTAREAALSSFEGQRVPLDRIIDASGVVRENGRSPLFQVSFGYEHAEDTGRGPDLPGTWTRPYSVETDTAKFELSLVVGEQPDGSLEPALEYATGLFTEATARGLLDAFTGLVSELPDVERDAGHDDVLARMTRNAFRSPETTAIEFEGRDHSYRWLLEQVERVAALLAEQGVGQGDLVGVLADRTPLTVAAMLGAWRIGAAYLPLDPDLPAARLRRLVAGAGPAVLLTDEAPAPEGLVAPVLDVGAVPVETTAPPRPGPTDGSARAYVLYTSGSTGPPKGVAVPQRAVLAMVEDSLHLLGAEALTSVLASTSFSFDLSVLELFAPLAVGGTIRLVSSVFERPAGPNGRRSTLIVTVPFLAAEALRHGSLDAVGATVCLGGEPLRGALVDQIHAAGAARVLNLYGPSEDTSYSTAATVPPGTPHPTLGFPVPGGRLHLLDSEGLPVPEGGIGEVYLGGAGLADGYLGRPRLTAERFVPDLHSKEPGARLYRTGDLGRIDSNGELEYYGRIDRQVKVNGVRVELAEVEHVLCATPGIEDGAATLETHGGASGLAALVVLRPGATVPEVRSALRADQPSHLVPTTILAVTALPRLPNGKVDVRAVTDTLARTRRAGSTRPDGNRTHT